MIQDSSVPSNQILSTEQDRQAIVDPVHYDHLFDY